MPRGSASNDSLYSPIVGGGRHIRVLTLQGSKGTYDPVICSLGLADLDDRTEPYNDAMETFEHTYPNDDLSRTRKASARHFFWNYWNLDPVRARMGWDDDMALKVAGHESLYDFCDRPLRTFGDAMPDRYKWGDYLALSYVCGDLNDGRTIEVNDIPIEIGRNLYNALIRLRQSYEVKDRKLKVWVDAICINQLDPAEKAAEVTRMNLIYSEALVTWGWLGQRQSDSTLGPFKEHFSACLSAIDALGMGDVAEVMKFSRSPLTEPDVQSMIRRFGSTKGRLTESTPLQLLDTFQFLGTSNVMAQDLPPYFAYMVKFFIESDTFSYFLWCIIDAISEAPYWHRSWINQEMALSSSIAFWYEDFELTAKGLAIIFWVFCSNHDRYNSFIGQYVDQKDCFRGKLGLSRVMLVLCNLRHSRHLRLIESRDYLISMIAQAHETYATDQRDKVYGLLALLPHDIASRIKPNYQESWTWQDTWTEFSKTCFEYEGRLDILGCCKNTMRTECLPSWAFDLTSSERYHPLSGLPSGATKDDYPDLENYLPGRSFIKGLADRDLSVRFQFSDDGRTLHCRCLLIDEIVTVAGMSDPGRPKVSSRTTVASQASFESTKLSLARVMMEDSSYQFSHGPSILDIPFLDQNQLEVQAISDARDCEPHSILERPEFDLFISYWVSRAITEAGGILVPWRLCILSHGFSQAWRMGVVAFQNFMINDRPLRHYFDSQERCCQDWPRFEILAGSSFLSHHQRRLFTTREGRLGCVTGTVIPGDKVAIIYGCHVPVILRPKDQAYQLIARCFVDGLMNGESVEILRSCEVTPTDIAIV